MNDTKSLIRNFVVSNFLFGQSDKLQDDSSFLETGIIDSTGVLELVAFLEKQFSIKVTDGEMTPDNLDSIALVAAYVDRKRSERAAA